MSAGSANCSTRWYRFLLSRQPRHVGPRIVPGRIGRVLGDADGAEIDLGDQQPFLIRAAACSPIWLPSGP